MSWLAGREERKKRQSGEEKWSCHSEWPTQKGESGEVTASLTGCREDSHPRPEIHCVVVTQGESTEASI